jgi:enoyl-CoA hydratase/carnithine racemase
MSDETILCEKRNGIGFIRFNRPKVLNAINRKLLSDFLAVLRAVEIDEDVRVVILQGEGRAFCAGDDLNEVQPAGWQKGLEFVEMLQDTTRVILRMPQPVIAALHGYAVGAGLEWAMNCDIRIAAEGTKLGFPETGIGFTVTNAGTKFLPLLVGSGRAKELVFSCRKIDAVTAERWGLVNQVVPLEDLERTAVDLAHTFMQNSPLAIALSKRALNQGLCLGMEETLELETRDIMVAVTMLQAMLGDSKSSSH